MCEIIKYTLISKLKLNIPYIENIENDFLSSEEETSNIIKNEDNKTLYLKGPPIVNILDNFGKARTVKYKFIEKKSALETDKNEYVQENYDINKKIWSIWSLLFDNFIIQILYNEKSNNKIDNYSPIIVHFGQTTKDKFNYIKNETEKREKNYYNYLLKIALFGQTTHYKYKYIKNDIKKREKYYKVPKYMVSKKFKKNYK